jgi:RNA polymerase sigma-70 factor (ECF subfamily)
LKRLNDNEIVALFLKRDESAIEETQKKYGRYCFSIANNILHNKEDAEESVNDTYLNAWNSIPPHQPEVFSTFLGKITRHLSLKKWRDKTADKRGGGEVTLTLEELQECIPTGQSVEDEVQNHELVLVINTFVKSLPLTERRIFICRYWYFDSIATIAKEFGLSQNNIKITLYRTRQKLLKILEQEGVFL